MNSAPELAKKTDERKKKEKKCKHSLLLFGTAFVVVVVLVSAVVLLSVCYAEVFVKEKNNNNINIDFRIVHEPSVQNEFNWLYFEEKGDVERVTVQMNNSIIVFVLSEKIVFGGNNRTYVFLDKIENRAIVVDVDNDCISTVMFIERVEHGVITKGEVNVGRLSQPPSTILNENVKILSDGEFPPKFTRRGPKNELITIYPTPSTTVLERRSSHELQLLLGKSSNSTKALQLRMEKRLAHENDEEVKREPRWEEMRIWPSALNFSAENLLGTLDFRNEEAISIYSYLQGNFIGSPFKHKYGRMTDYGFLKKNPGPIEVNYNADDCGRVSQRTEAGDIFWMELKKRDARMRLASSGVDLLVWGGKILETSDGKLRVDMENDTVMLANAIVHNYTKLCNKKTTWNSSNTYVKMENKCQKNTEWHVESHGGKFSTDPLFKMPLTLENFKESVWLSPLFGNNTAAVATSDEGMATTECNYRMDLQLTYYYAEQHIRPQIRFRSKEDNNTFDIRAAPGRVLVRNDIAEISSFAANISIAPFYVRFD